jgi:predicted nucleic acid-binding protein
LIVYADSSFLATLYIRDSRLSAARKWILQKPQVFLTPLHRTELAHTFYFQVFRQRIRAVEAQFAWEAFQNDCSKGIWTSVPMPVEAWILSTKLAAKHGPILGVRTLDSLHVACALECLR